MQSHPRLAALLELVPADHGQDEGVDWAQVEAVLGRRLPSDYIAFMKTYGAGDFSDVLGVHPPLTPPTDGWALESVGEPSEDPVFLWEADPPRMPLDLDPGDLLKWGGTCGPDDLYWLATDPDPDVWPVVVRGRHTKDTWTRHPCGMTEFLHEVLSGQFSPWPLSVAWREPPAPFVHWREQRRRWFAGLDPITGLPDPYAEMFPR